MQRLQCPRHFTPGASELTLTKDVDKNRWNRSLPLSDRTVRYLDALCTDEKNEAIVGFIFGEYAYLKTLRATARKIRTKLELSEEACNMIDARDFRHGAGSHMAEVSTDVAGIAYMMGHRDVRTSSRYIHPRLHAGRRVTQARFSGPALGPGGVNESEDDPEDPEILSGREGIRTPDFCLRSPNPQPESPRFRVVLGEEPCATERDGAPLTPLLGPVVPKDIELFARRALSDPDASNRELTLAKWILKGLG